MTQQRPILVIGAGVSGLALANGLQKHKIPFKLFERDLSHAYRAQGYRLRIAAEGLTALEYLLDKSTWDNFLLTCADMRWRPIPVIDALRGETDKGANTKAPPPREGERPPTTVDRTVLREVLLRGLQKGSVEYGKALDRYEENENGVKAFFQDGTSAEGSLIVGADGAHSHVRRQFLPQLEVVDTAGRCIYGKTVLTDEVIKKLPDDIMGGMSAVKDNSHKDILSMVVEPTTFPRRKEMEEQGFTCPPDYLYWVLVSKPRTMGYTLEDEFGHFDAEKAEQLALKVSKNWHPSTRAILEHQQRGETSTLPIRSVKPDFGAWEPNPHVTVLGDAIHLMGPTAGSGAITALRDASNLCQTLVDQGLSKESIGSYEAKMREYASKIVELSWLGGKHIFGMRRWDEEEGESDDEQKDDGRSIGEVMEEIRKRR
ncbi:hypothetical protein PRZ48_009822 [Zasmidium cellare]|uniref:FAD-binding domain-containing protein n=1 Tax=Zasmidium cellare TaxID=395010 RepID=A0ABR0ECS6_ZASCE|nr:hypothetical protein PRZ48_009822 [Zasmidium cellare]